ncbi:MAG: IS66 family insertion sequence element accessory protein TnpB [candidate division KSB1 bacterium]|nr:IS66 family insertion sequence element accessory protein TnpB [candidate division KSB1 bacterium]MDZ7287986.1 IS66 family insertion sequence element accessory protein TnpB [candidate division KSB1 bacterium]MDZ7351003.1 IS66 family insertion sequence element accessory protein TnpB [candidate division KSB1 bacterium]MDZ7355456.1 IS66 family insertion sequence element accessory protein TnpB [candidate division KSB1 bacterium]MDZ7418485.1 IS66 family insertion sequence element accessory protein
MIALSPGLRFYLYSQATDMRKSFDGLSGIVTSILARDPMSGEVYIFLNRRRDRMKLLLWDRTGFWLFYKRLEQGTFQLPDNFASHTSLELRYDELMLILEGIDLASVKRRRRYQRGQPSLEQ